MSDQDIISPNNINTISSRQVMRIKKNIDWGIINWSKTKFSELTLEKTVWQAGRRITDEILEAKGLMT